MKLTNIPIRVAIDGGNSEPFGQVQNGIQRLIDSFLKSIKLSKNSKFIYNYYYFNDQTVPGHPKGGRAQLMPKELPKRFFASFHLPYNIIKNKDDVFLAFSGYLPKLLKYHPTTKIIFIHDLGFLKYPRLYSEPEKLKRNTEFAIIHADKIVVFSEHVKREIRKYFHISYNKIIKINPGTDHLVSWTTIYKHSYTRKYFLYVGVIKPIKNINKLLKIFNKFLHVAKNKDYKLILIGPKEVDYYKNLQSSPLFIKLKNKLIFIEKVSDKQLIKYYLDATSVLNVSLEEGFCYPVAEALSLGKKVIVNNLPIFKEFNKYFSNLYIGKSEIEIIKFMLKVSKAETRSAKININKRFTWKNFSSALLEEFIS